MDWRMIVTCWLDWSFDAISFNCIYFNCFFILKFRTSEHFPVNCFHGYELSVQIYWFRDRIFFFFSEGPFSFYWPSPPPCRRVAPRTEQRGRQGAVRSVPGAAHPAPDGECGPAWGPGGPHRHPAGRRHRGVGPRLPAPNGGGVHSK